MNWSLKALSDPRVLDGGKRVAFTVERHDGSSLEVSCPTQELADLIAFLAGLGFYASEKAAEFDSTPRLLPPTARIPSFGIGFAHAPDETLLLVDLRGFQLVFPISNSDLTRLADDVSRIARTLAADSSKKN